MKISVLIPTYGRPDYLEQALESVTNQSRPPDEVVVSDNHPTISAGEVVRKFGGRLRVRRVVPPKTMSMDAHWLWAFRQPTCDIIALLEDDNLWRSNHLECMQTAWAAFPAASIAGTAAIEFGSITEGLQREVFAPVWGVNLLTQEPLYVSNRAALGTALLFGTFASSAVSFLRSAMLRVLPEGSQNTNAFDRVYWGMLAAEGGAVFLPEISVLYRKHAEQAVKKISKHYYRKESAIGIRTIAQHATTKGWDIVDCFVEMWPYLSVDAQQRAGELIVQTRDRDLIESILPKIPMPRSLWQHKTRLLRRFVARRLSP